MIIVYTKGNVHNLLKEKHTEVGANAYFSKHVENACAKHDVKLHVDGLYVLDLDMGG